ncbi:MAG: hypothetical protein AAGE18_11020 [Pseudomonadota bacterium]
MASTLLTGTVFVAAIVALALGSYGIARWAFGARADEETRDLAGSVLFRIGALHGLVLALVFAQDLAGIRDVAVSAAREATLVSDIYHDARRYGVEETAGLRAGLARYGLIVVEEEWPLLAESRRLSPAAWTEWEAAYETLLDLAPATPRQERLHDVMLDDIRELSELRDARENAAQAAAYAIFLWVALAGVVLIGAAYFTWPATALNVGLIAAFAGFTGLILYMVFAFSNPFAAPGRATTVGFERFLTPEVRALATRPAPGGG